MLNKLGLSTIALATLGIVASSQAAVISYYNFNSITPITTAGTPAVTGTTTLSPTTGSGSISLASFGGNVDDFAGSTINAIGADVAGASLSLLAGGVTGGPYPGNNTYADIAFSLTGFENPILTFASQRTGTGFTGNTFSYSTDGLTFTPIAGTITPATAYALVTLDLSAIDAVDNAASVTLRYTLLGGSSASGNNRLDNVQVNASAIVVTPPEDPGTPEPASLALIGLVGMGALRRHRA